MKAFIPRESKRCNTDGRSEWTAGKNKLKNKPHLYKFAHWNIVNLNSSKKVWKSEFDQELLSYLNDNRRMLGIIRKIVNFSVI